MFQRLASFVLFASMASLVSAYAQAAEPVAGKDYQLIEPAVPTKSGEQIEVVEVFGYSCGHCANFAPQIHDWKQAQPADVSVEYLPAVFGGTWDTFARIYYTAAIMGVADRTHEALFEALHTERRQMNSVEAIADFYAEHGADKEQFLSTFDSFPVNAKLADARTRVRSYGVDATPMMVIAGKYRVSAPREGGFTRMLEITDYLVEKERLARKTVDK